MHFSHPKTIPHPWYEEKLSSTKPDPGAKKVGTTVGRTDFQWSEQKQQSQSESY